MVSQSDGFTRVEWKVLYPAAFNQTTGTVGWVVCLADEAQNRLVRLVFESPENEWAAVESVGAELMTSVRRTTVQPKTR